MVSKQTVIFTGLLSLIVSICIAKSEDPTPIKRFKRSVNRDSCDGKPFNQIIRFGTGCRNVIVENKLCLGNCITAYVPSQNDPMIACRQCKPATNTTIEVSTTCHNTHSKPMVVKQKVEGSETEKKLPLPIVQRKQILKILSCKCDDCQ